MKKNIIFKSLVLIVILLITFLTLNSKEVNKFKKDYEKLNNKTNENGKKYKNIKISNDNPIVYASYKEIFNVLDNTGVIYFGFPECPWCRNAVPVLLDAAQETGIDKIYYMNNLKDRDIKTLKEGNIITEKEGTKNYNKLLKRLDGKVSVYNGLNDENIKRLYFPTVIVVKNGKIVDYIEGTVDTQKDPYKPLSKKEEKELKEKYIKAINKTLMCEKTKC